MKTLVLILAVSICSCTSLRKTKNNKIVLFGNNQKSDTAYVNVFYGTVKYYK